MITATVKKKKDPDALKVAQNVIKRYGVERFLKLIEAFHENTPGAEICAEFGVTRQRVQQWKQTLGTQHVMYELDADVAALVESKTVMGKTTAV